MELIVCNNNFERIGIINDASSKIWHRKYYEPGDFEIYLPANSENLNLLQIGYYIVRDDDGSVGIIEDYDIIYDNTDEVDMMKVIGKFSESIYSRRIVWQQTILDTKLEAGLRTLINDNIINPKNLDLSLTKGGSSAIASISNSSTGITGAVVNKTTFENYSYANANTGESVGITGTAVNKTTFETKIDKSGTYNFMYDGTNWNLDNVNVVLADYGITYTGTALSQDEIIIVYSNEMKNGAYNFSYKANSSSIKTKTHDYMGLTRANTILAIFETKITATGNYKFVYGSNTSLASASKGTSSGITGASVNKTTFESKLSETNNYHFKYTDSQWKLNNVPVTLSQYGITYTGTPSNNDEITIYYSRHTWKLSNTNKNIAEYGVSYAGTPTTSAIIAISYVAPVTGWFFNGNLVTLTNFGITYTGTLANNDTIIITYQESTGITTASVDKLKFQKKASKNGTYLFTYNNNNNWELDGIEVDLSSYGITYEGIPVKTNAITVILTNMSNRIISEVQLGTLKGYDELLSAQYTGDDLGKVITESCQPNGIGYKNVFENGLFKFELYKGADRSYNQTENPYVVFSDEYDNLTSSGYVKATSNYKNTALIAGEGEGLLRTKKELNSNNSGLNRRELFVDAKSVSSNSGKISDSDYGTMLLETGTETLSKYLITEVFTGDVELTDRYIYKTDVDLGDICTIENKEWGVYLNSRIVGVIETDDENGETIVFEFGS